MRLNTKISLPTAILFSILWHININIECEISDLLLFSPLSKPQHLENNFEKKCSLSYLFKTCTILDLQWKCLGNFFSAVLGIRKRIFEEIKRLLYGQAHDIRHSLTHSLTQSVCHMK